MAFRWTFSIAVIAAWPLAAHHNQAANFDTTKLVTLKGVVTQVEWVNPHVWLHMDVKDADGKVIAWMVEISSPNSLQRQKVTKDSFRQGETMVEVFVAKDGSRRADAKEGGMLTLANGKKITIPCCWVADTGKIVFGPAAVK